MRSDKRRKPRKPLRYSAWLHVGPGLPRACLVADISDTGARLDVDGPEDLPDRFVLMLSDSGAARRFCRLVWRSAKQVGVQFEKGVDFSDPAAR